MADTTQETDITAEVNINVSALGIHAVPDDQPSIEAHSSAVAYDVSFNTNFSDRCGFVMGISKYVEEAQSHGTLVSLRGLRFASDLCVALVIPL